MLILGLDVSTSIIGYAIIELVENKENIVKIGHIDFKKCNDFWEKTDKAKSEIESILDSFLIDKCFIEESLLGFSTGLSSAATLFTLAKFNALVSYFVREITKKPVEYISANSARKTVGIKLIQKKKCGISHKEQAFKWAVAGPLKDRVMPMNRTLTNFKSFVFDEVDSYIIALAGAKLCELQSSIVIKTK